VILKVDPSGVSVIVVQCFESSALALAYIIHKSGTPKSFFVGARCEVDEGRIWLDPQVLVDPVSKGQECSGPFEEPTPSWLSAAAISMASLKTTGRNAGRRDFHL
jgi:hypothetical protein